MPRAAASLLSLLAGLTVLGGVLLLAPKEALDPRRWRAVDWPWIFPAAAAYAGVYAARAFRFRALLREPRLPLGRLLRVVALHNLANQWLPARSGELIFVVLANRRLDRGLPDAAAALVAARLLDAAAVTGIFLAGLAALPGRRAGAPALLALGALSAVAASLWLLPAVAARLTRALPEGRARRALLEALPALRSARRPGVVLVSALQWLLTLSAVASLARAAGLGADLAGFFLGSAGLSLALLLPLNAPGNLGTFEAGWVFGFGLAGLPAERTVPAALLAHAALLAFTALYAWPALRAEGRAALAAAVGTEEKENLADAP